MKVTFHRTINERIYYLGSINSCYCTPQDYSNRSVFKCVPEKHFCRKDTHTNIRADNTKPTVTFDNVL